MIEFDLEKERRSIHGIPFDLAAELFAADFIERVDARFDYGETRFIATGPVASLDLIRTAVYTWRGVARRIISFRRSSDREIGEYRGRHP